MKRVVILLAALYGAGTVASVAHAQQAQSDTAIIAVAQPAVNELLKSLPVDTTLNPTQVFADNIGQAHVRLTQFYKGIPVFEGDAIIHIDLASNTVIGTTNATLPFKAIRVTPSVSSARAAEAARTHFAQPLGLSGRKDLTILVNNGVASLTWKVHSEGEGRSGHIDTIAFIGAQNATVLRSWNNLQTGAVDGTANGMFMDTGGSKITVDQVDANTFYLRNPGSTTTPTSSAYYTCDYANSTLSTAPCTVYSGSTSAFGSGSITTSGSTAAADAQYGAQKTLEYYKTTFGRNGIDNANMSTYSRVHYSTNYENAFWSDTCSCMTYGDGATTFYPVVSIDVAGHEMSHGVTSRTANLTYSGESGGLNEATSDIFGTMVEFYANGARDVPDYKIGEMVLKSNWTSGQLTGGGALRYMYEPGKDGRSRNCWSSTLKTLDVHFSSGVANHFFYLLAEGSNTSPASPTCNGSVVTGIGRDAAQRIWYRALTVYMTRSTNYSGARAATIKAATDIYGSAGANSVAAAWNAVSVVK